jgi:hypothetical protein
MSTTGSIVPPLPSKQDFTQGGGISKYPVPASQSSALLIMKGQGRLMKVLVTATLSTAWTFYDSGDPTKTSTATIIGVIPSGATAGTIYDLRMPVDNGIVASPGSSAAGTLTVSYS